MSGPKGNIVGERIDAPSVDIEDGQPGPVRITPKRALHVSLRGNDGGEVTVPPGLVPETYDFIDLNYTGSNLTEVIYKTGGSGGTTVATLALTYSGSDLDTVTKT